MRKPDPRSSPADSPVDAPIEVPGQPLPETAEHKSVVRTVEANHAPQAKGERGQKLSGQSKKQK